MSTLKLVPASGSPVEVDGDQAIVGRDPSCDVVVNDASVSRKHARVERWGGNWAVVDQRSANGTFLDGQRIAESMVRAGQEVRFGAVAYRVEIEEGETGATVLMSIPTIDATVLDKRAVPTPRAVPRPPTPPTPPPPVARPAVPPPSRPSVPPPVHAAPAPEPVRKGRSAWFWAALGCGGILALALVATGAFVGLPFLGSRGAQGGGPAGDEPTPAPSVPALADSGRLVVETIATKKSTQGQTVTVKIDVRVTGFDLRPEGSAFRVDLAEDLETFGPDGRRIDELSREGLETFNQTTTSATDATATFNTSLTFSRPDPGRYRAALTIRDLVGGKSKRHEVPFDLP